MYPKSKLYKSPLILISNMKISELEPRQGKVEIQAEVTEKEEPREFEKFGKKGRVCNAVIKDDSGSVKLTLWNEQVDSVNIGDVVKIQNGWVGEWQGEKQLTTGKFGKLEVVSKSENPIVTNDPDLLNNSEDSEIASEEFVDDLE